MRLIDNSFESTRGLFNNNQSFDFNMELVTIITYPIFEYSYVYDVTSIAPHQPLPKIYFDRFLRLCAIDICVVNRHNKGVICYSLVRRVPEIQKSIVSD